MKAIYCLIIVFHLTIALSAQSEKQWGIHIGVPFINEMLVEKRSYVPIQLLATLTRNPFLKRGKHRMAFTLEPQLIWVLYRPAYGNDYEFGLNINLDYSYLVAPKAMIKTCVGTGPHFITAYTNQQARGFIFSDNLSAGFEKQLGTAFALRAMIRFRHISNANLKKPNKGIDTWLIMIGIIKNISS
jgi:hypothetical protein